MARIRTAAHLSLYSAVDDNSVFRLRKGTRCYWVRSCGGAGQHCRSALHLFSLMAAVQLSTMQTKLVRFVCFFEALCKIFPSLSQFEGHFAPMWKFQQLKKLCGKTTKHCFCDVITYCNAPSGLEINTGSILATDIHIDPQSQDTDGQ